MVKSLKLNPTSRGCSCPDDCQKITYTISESRLGNFGRPFNSFDRLETLIRSFLEVVIAVREGGFHNNVGFDQPPKQLF
jgi:hypothetical protein